MSAEDQPTPMKPPAQAAADLAALAELSPGGRPGARAAMLAEGGAPAARLFPALAAALRAGLSVRPGEAPPEGAPGHGGIPLDAALWALHGERVLKAPAPVRAAVCAGFRLRAQMGFPDPAPLPAECWMTVPTETLRADLLALARSLAPGQRTEVVRYASHGATAFLRDEERAGLERILSEGRTDASEGWESVAYTADIPARTGWAQCVALLLLRALDAAAEGPDRAAIPYIQVERLLRTRIGALEDLSLPRQAVLAAGFRGVFERHLAPEPRGEGLERGQVLPWGGA